MRHAARLPLSPLHLPSSFFLRVPLNSIVPIRRCLRILSIVGTVPKVSPGGTAWTTRVWIRLKRRGFRVRKWHIRRYPAIIVGLLLACTWLSRVGRTQTAIPWENGLAAGVKTAISRQSFETPVGETGEPAVEPRTTELEDRLEESCTTCTSSPSDGDEEESLWDRWRHSEDPGCTAGCTATGSADAEDMAPFLRRNMSVFVGIVGSKQPQDWESIVSTGDVSP